MREKPTLFVGSSSEGLMIARAVKQQLSGEAEVTVWDEGIFEITRATIESISNAPDQFDFAVFVLTPDDMIVKRDQQMSSARDNVIFEAGLFMGRLGRDRVFLVCPDDKSLTIPSDLLSVTVALYPSEQARRNMVAAVGVACGPIRAAMVARGPSPNSRLLQFNQLATQLDHLFHKTNDLLREMDALHTRPMWFETVAKAEDEMARRAKECVENGEPIKIQWLGMTMYNVWNTLPRVLDQLAEKDGVGLSLEIAMLSSEWLLGNRINSAWTPTSANETKKRILGYFEKKRNAGVDWKCEIHRYSHMPGVHGGLINDRYLFLGICRWDHDDLWAGDRPYELYSQGDPNHGSDKLRVFKSWFDFSFRFEMQPEVLQWPTMDALERKTKVNAVSKRRQPSGRRASSQSRS